MIDPKQIKNNVLGVESLGVDRFLESEFNNLKESEGRDVTELKNSILEFGFTIPVFVWFDSNDNIYVLDGTGRKQAVEEMLADGYTFDSIPFVEIKASTKEDAMKIVPVISSSYGETTRDSFIRFAKDLKLNFSTIKIDGISKKILEGDNFNFKNKEVSFTASTEEKQGKHCPNCGHELVD